MLFAKSAFTKLALNAVSAFFAGQKRVLLQSCDVMGLMTNSNVHFLANISSVSIDCILNYECWHSLDSFITTTVAKVFRTSVLKNLPFPAKFVSRS